MVITLIREGRSHGSGFSPDQPDVTVTCSHTFDPNNFHLILKGKEVAENVHNIETNTFSVQNNPVNNIWYII